MDFDMENSELIDKLRQELRLRKYSSRTEKSYVYVVEKFLRSNKEVKDFLSLYTNRGRSTIRTTFFSLKFFFENVLDKRFDDEKIPLAKNTLKLPVVLNKKELESNLNTWINLF